MNEKDINEIFEFSDKRVVDLVIQDVNLSEKEYAVIESIKLRKRTVEKTAEILDISIRNIYRIKEIAIKKIASAWQYNTIVNLILNSRRVV